MDPYSSPSAIKYMSNMERINKINSKLNSIQNSLSNHSPISYTGQYSKSNIQNSSMNNIEERLTSLEQKNFEIKINIS